VRDVNRGDGHIGHGRLVALAASAPFAHPYVGAVAATQGARSAPTTGSMPTCGLSTTTATTSAKATRDGGRGRVASTQRSRRRSLISWRR
jgi:hypothetical protein